MKGGVGLPVATAVEPVASDLAAGGGAFAKLGIDLKFGIPARRANILIVGEVGAIRIVGKTLVSHRWVSSFIAPGQPVDARFCSVLPMLSSHVAPAPGIGNQSDVEPSTIR